VSRAAAHVHALERITRVADHLRFLLEPAVERVEVDLDAALEVGVLERPGGTLGRPDVPDLGPPLLRLGGLQHLHPHVLARERPPRHHAPGRPHQPHALAVHDSLAADLTAHPLVARLVAEGVAGEDV
jgi:hypothetical protein